MEGGGVARGRARQEVYSVYWGVRRRGVGGVGGQGVRRSGMAFEDGFGRLPSSRGRALRFISSLADWLWGFRCDP